MSNAHTELEAFHKLAAENAAHMFNASEDHEVLPMWHAIDRDGNHFIIATPWDGEREKNITARMLRAMFADKGVDMFAFISEAWVAQLSLNEDPKNHPPPSQHPDRREVLMINAESRKGGSISSFYYILRPEHGPPTLSPLKINDYDGMKGRFTGMLKP